MKFLAIFLLITVAVALPATELSDDEEWELFKGKHAGKGFKSAEEHDFRKGLFKKANAIIKAHNMENHTFKLAHNKHSILTEEEKAQRRGRIPGMNQVNDVQARSIESLIEERVAIPTSYDLRTTTCGQKMAVKDQGQCGCCWAFSAIDPIEYQKCNKTGTYARLSEELLIDCDTASYNAGCNGGIPSYALSFLKNKNTGKVATGSSYPFSAAAGTSGTCKTSYTTGANLTSYATIAWTNASAMVAPIQSAILNYGVVSACLLVSDATTTVSGTIVPKFDYYSSGVYTDAVCNKTVSGSGQSVTNHCVALVGWGHDAVTNLDYWIMRNQWGTSWGNGGYMNIQRGVNMCGIEGEVTYVTVA